VLFVVFSGVENTVTGTETVTIEVVPAPNCIGQSHVVMVLAMLYDTVWQSRCTRPGHKARWYERSQSCGGGSSGFRGADVAKVDRIKEEIGWLKLVFGILVAIDVSLVGWLSQHYETASPVLVLAAVLATAVGTFAVVRVNRLAYHRIEQLEDL